MHLVTAAKSYETIDYSIPLFFAKHEFFLELFPVYKISNWQDGIQKSSFFKIFFLKKNLSRTNNTETKSYYLINGSVWLKRYKIQVTSRPCSEDKSLQRDKNFQNNKLLHFSRFPRKKDCKITTENKNEYWKFLKHLLFISRFKRTKQIF